MSDIDDPGVDALAERYPSVAELIEDRRMAVLDVQDHDSRRQVWARRAQDAEAELVLADAARDDLLVERDRLRTELAETQALAIAYLRATALRSGIDDPRSAETRRNLAARLGVAP